jgi:hypothetical protein
MIVQSHKVKRYQRRHQPRNINIIMNSTPYHHQPGNDSRRIGVASSTAHTSFEALESKISLSEMFRMRNGNAFTQRSSPTTFSKSTAGADASTKGGSDMQVLRIPTKSENCKPGPKLNPASCASGLALGGDISDLSLTAFVERINRLQGNTRRRNSTLQNEDWDILPSYQGNLFLSNGNN